METICREKKNEEEEKEHPVVSLSPWSITAPRRSVFVFVLIYFSSVERFISIQNFQKHAFLWTWWYVNKYHHIKLSVSFKKTCLMNDWFRTVGWYVWTWQWSVLAVIDVDGHSVGAEQARHINIWGGCCRHHVSKQLFLVMHGRQTMWPPDLNF